MAVKKFKFRWFDKAGNSICETFTLPGNAAMLIGTDCDGREVYEGDKVMGEDGKIGSAKLEAQEFIGTFKLVEVVV